MRRGPDPQIPLHFIRNHNLVTNAGDAVVVSGPGILVFIDVSFPNRPDGAIADPLHHGAAIFGGMALNARLHDGFGVPLFGGYHCSHLMDRVRQRLLAVDVFAHFHRRYGGVGMGVVGGAHHHRIHRFVHFLEHRAPIVKAFRRWVLLHGFYRRPWAATSAPVHVAQGNDILAGQFPELRPAKRPESNETDIRASHSVGLLLPGQGPGMEEL